MTAPCCAGKQALSGKTSLGALSELLAEAASRGAAAGKLAAGLAARIADAEAWEARAAAALAPGARMRLEELEVRLRLILWGPLQLHRTSWTSPRGRLWLLHATKDSLEFVGLKTWNEVIRVSACCTALLFLSMDGTGDFGHVVYIQRGHVAGGSRAMPCRNGGVLSNACSGCRRSWRRAQRSM